MHKMDNNMFDDDDQQQKQKTSFEDGLRKVLKSAKVNETITSKDLVSKYGVPSDAASLINSFTKLSDSSIKIDWVSGLNPKMMLVNGVSDAIFKDGNINIVPLKNGTIQISGNGIGIKYQGKVYNNLIINNNSATIPNVKGMSWKIGF
ncbi:hypothetical protein B0A58_08850 [Flavobacterium branchiophilum NBRC 15030 = ATCC 35035]|nr:hypothetical protein B0A58_08850 [Flavobacterium branchiophilum NBRC 15030 = ATCC 35035]GEM54754.1 hypothetical protein FB1_09750 [Flavobacterium branchiophilum NBRC 15030 = ATCC 35035]